MLGRNSPDPGVLALPDGSGTLKEVSIVLLHLCSLRPNGIQLFSRLTYPQNAVLLRPDKTISTPQAMPWSLLPTLRTNQMAILHFHYIFPPTWYPQIQNQQAQIKSRSIGLRRAMCSQQGPGHRGPWRTCGPRRSIL